MNYRIPNAAAFLIAAIVLAFSCNTGSCQETEGSTAPAIKEAPIVVGTSLKVKSNVLGDEREINLWLPPSYSKGDKRYPVLYLIDGALDQDFQHIAGLCQLASINSMYEELILVGIQTKNRIDELTSKPLDPRYIRNLPRGGKSPEFLKFIRTEVMPLIESRYRTGDRKAVLGESLAGLFIAEVFLRAPDTFTDYISVSPSLWWDDKALAKAATELVAAHDDSKRQVYFSMADEGGTMQAGLDIVMEAIEKNKPAGLTMHYVDRRSTERHSTIYHGAAFDALQKLFGISIPEYGEIPWYLIEGGQPPEAPKEEKKDDDAAGED